MITDYLTAHWRCTNAPRNTSLCIRTPVCASTARPTGGSGASSMGKRPSMALAPLLRRLCCGLMKPHRRGPHANHQLPSLRLRQTELTSSRFTILSSREEEKTPQRKFGSPEMQKKKGATRERRRRLPILLSRAKNAVKEEWKGAFFFFQKRKEVTRYKNLLSIH